MNRDHRRLVSIIIVNWNGGEVFKNCLWSLFNNDYKNYELIVVDNNSTDNSLKYLGNKNKNIKLIRNKENVGFAPANNQGFKVSSGEYILLLNNDTKIKKDTLPKLIARMENDKSLGVVQPKIYMMDKPGYLDNAGSYFTKLGFLEHWGFGQKDGKEFMKETQVFSAKGACILIRREVIEKVGLFDLDFVSYFEESDFCWRVWLSGYKIIFYPGAEIYHKVGFTIRRLDVADINFHYYKNRINSLIKNLGLVNLFLIVPVHLFVSLGIAFLFLVRGNLKNAVFILKAIFWNIENFPTTLKKRKKVQQNRKITDSELFRNLSRPINLAKFFGDFKRVEKDLSRKQEI